LHKRLVSEQQLVIGCDATAIGVVLQSDDIPVVHEVVEIIDGIRNALVRMFRRHGHFVLSR
jgi:hypothetical protein